MKLSIVTTLYYSEPYLDEFYQRISCAAKKITDEYELIYVNDGSPDQALEKALQQQQADAAVVVIDLSRNFGHHQAGMTGIEASRGDLVFLIDCDLEEAPELLTDFWAQLQQAADLDVVYGVQGKRKGQRFERYSGAMFYRVFNFLSNTKIAENILTVRLMRRCYVNALKLYSERNLFLGGLMAHAGFRQLAVPVHKLSKKTRSYTLLKQFHLLLTALLSFSDQPLLFIFYSGLACIVLAVSGTLAYGVLFMSGVLLNHSVWQIFLIICWFSGFVVSSCGVLGLYLSRIYEEVKQRPRTVINKVYKRD